MVHLKVFTGLKSKYEVLRNRYLIFKEVRDGNVKTPIINKLFILAKNKQKYLLENMKEKKKLIFRS